MNGLWMPTAALERLAGALLHFVWQGAAIAIVAAVLLRLLRRRSPEYRYAAASAALLGMLAAPVATFFFYAETGALAERLLRALNGAVAMPATEAAASGMAIWAQRIVLVWAAGVLICLARLAGGWILSRRMVETATAEVSAAAKDALERAREGLSFSRPVRLLAGVRIETPVVIGWLRPAILLPASALTGLDADQLLAILAHELAHVRRHDFLVNAAQRTVECVLFYHPAVWWISARIRVERELCCDDLAVRVCGDRLVYAQALIAIEKVRSIAQAFAVPAAGNGLADRVRRILGARSANRDWQSAAAALLFAVILAGAGMWQPPVLAGGAIPFAPPRPQPAPPLEAVAAPVEVLPAIVALATAQGVRAPAEAAPREQPPRPQVAQPPIPAAREAARERLGQLRVDYSADSFVKQAAEGDTVAIKTFLVAGMNINVRDTAGFTALTKAAQAGQTETVQSLLAAGANPDLDATWKDENKNSQYGSALSISAERGDLPTMKVLLAAGANVNLKVGVPNQGRTALARALTHGRTDAVSLLLDNKAAIDQAGAGWPAILLAACEGGSASLPALLARGADVNARPDDSSRTALMCVASNRDAENLRLLLDKGADINVSSNGDTPLTAALQNVGRAEPRREKSSRIALLLIEQGADVNPLKTKQGSYYYCPLQFAAAAGLTDVVRAILDKGADINALDGSGRSALYRAISQDGPTPQYSPTPPADVTATAMLLIDRGANVNVRTRDGDDTPLNQAVTRQQMEIVRALLAKGADPNTPLPGNGPDKSRGGGNTGTSAPSTTAHTLLQKAAGNAEITQLLLNAGAKP